MPKDALRVGLSRVFADTLCTEQRQGEYPWLDGPPSRGVVSRPGSVDWLVAEEAATFFANADKSVVMECDDYWVVIPAHSIMDIRISPA